jgi:transcriptional regulator with AAA-type ATPase domain
MQALTAYHWSGNIRELANAIERAILFLRRPDDRPPRPPSRYCRGEVNMKLS